MVKYEMLGLAAKYRLSDAREGLSTICFVQEFSCSVLLCFSLGSFHCSYVFYVSVCFTLCVLNK